MSPVVSYVVQTLVTLLGVVALAVLLLYGARRAGVGRPSGPVDLVGRLPLDARRAVYLVRVGTTVHVIGASETGLVKLGETTTAELEAGGGALPSGTDAPATASSEAERSDRAG